jgi:hypothetical protein
MELRAIILAAVSRKPSDRESTEFAEGGGSTLRVDRWLWCTRLF